MGGGLYGSSGYGSGYGYGGGIGGIGGGGGLYNSRPLGMLGQQPPQMVLGPNGEPIPVAPPPPPSLWQALQHGLGSGVDFFGRLAYIAAENAHAVHFFISALLMLLDRAGSLYGELARFLLRILGLGKRKKEGGALPAAAGGGGQEQQAQQHSNALSVAPPAASSAAASHQAMRPPPAAVGGQDWGGAWRGGA